MTTTIPPAEKTSTAVPAPAGRRKGAIRRVLGAALHTQRGVVGLILTLIVVAIAFLGPFLEPHSPTEFTTAPYSTPGSGNGLFGGDQLGRDVFSRLLSGGYSLLILAALATFLGVAVGAAIGVIAAYRQGWIAGVLMRLVDIVLSVPQLVFVLLIVSVIGAKDWILVLAVAGVQAPQVARVIFAAAQDVCERDFVKAVALWGVPPRRVIGRQILPNLSTPLAVESGLRLSFSIILISGLNFLGFGVQPPTASWGVMINENRLGLNTNPWGVIAPAILLGILAVGTNIFADAVARANSGADRASDHGASE